MYPERRFAFCIDTYGEEPGSWFVVSKDEKDWGSGVLPDDSWREHLIEFLKRCK